MPKRGLKQLAADRDLKVGHFIVEFATPGIGHIIKAAGCDFALFDTEHSGFGYETMKSVLGYMQAADLPAIVRVPSKAYHHIARAADMGAEGIMVPMVNSAAEARQILDAMKYVPQGRRGVALQIAHDRYLPGPVLDKLAAANRFTTCFAQIETRAGVDNADEIAALDGVDCLWIGHFDLSCSLGIPGDFGHRDFQDAVKAVTRACRRHKKALGRLVPTVEEGVRLYKSGHDFICYSGDVWALLGAVTEAVGTIRKGCAATRAQRRFYQNKTAGRAKTSAKPKTSARPKAAAKLTAAAKPKAAAKLKAASKAPKRPAGRGRKAKP
jgi:2-keto-3-deoxy-L-rhamnonate aldolase RhmA